MRRRRGSTPDTKPMWENSPRTTTVFPGCSDCIRAMAGRFTTSASGLSTKTVSFGREMISKPVTSLRREPSGDLRRRTTAMSSPLRRTTYSALL